MLTKLHYQVWFLSLLIVCFSAYYFLDFENTTLALLGFSGLILSFVLLFTKTNWFYYLLIGLIPLSLDTEIFGGTKVNLPTEAMLVLLLGTLFLLHKSYWTTFCKILFHPISLLLLADLLIQLVTSFFSSQIDVSLKRFVIKMLFILFFFVVVNMIEKPKKLINIFIAYAIGLIPVMYFTLKNHVRYDFDPRVIFEICAPYFNDHTIYGACLAFILPMLFIVFKSWKKFQSSSSGRWIFGLLVGIILLSLILALSRAAILSLLFSGIFALFLYYKISFKALVAFLGIFAIIGMFNWNSIYETVQRNDNVSNDGEIVNHFSSISNVNSDASNLERINRWICAVRMFEAKPLTGFGPGMYQFEYHQFQTFDNKTYISTNAGDRGNAHSEYLTYLSENGVIGFLIYMAFVFTVVYFGIQNHYQLDKGVLQMLNLGVVLGLSTFFFHGFFNMFIDQIKMASLVYTSVGIVVWINLRLKLKVNQDENN